MSGRQVLRLVKLARGTGGISPVYGASLAEAAAFCLEDQQHATGVRLAVEQTHEGAADEEAATSEEVPGREVAVEWEPLHEAAASTWNDRVFATEQGAYGLAILLIGAVSEWAIVERSRIGTGFDYWLHRKSSAQPFRAKLEVSGILDGDRSLLRQRVKKKLRQIERSNTTIPGYVIVIEFAEPCSQVAQR